MINKLNKNKILRSIQDAVKREDYALRSHAVRHMLAEGFDEAHILESIENGKIHEIYYEESRCLITGTFQVSRSLKEALHVVVDYWSESEEIDWVDLVTAYIPRYPFWETPYRRGRKK